MFSREIADGCAGALRDTPASHRARLMSLFQLGLGGGAPIGAFVAGSICAVWGLQAAMVLPALAMLLLIALVLMRSRLWSMRTVE